MSYKFSKFAAISKILTAPLVHIGVHKLDRQVQKWP